MPYPPRPPTGQAVSAALKRAGFNRSAVHRDGRLVKGSDQHTWGYEVRTIQGRITVRHILGGIGPVSDEGTKRAVRMVLRYADELLLAGFLVKIDEGGRSLIVHARRGLPVATDPTTRTEEAEQ